jgi:hypothetical protein
MRTEYRGALVVLGLLSAASLLAQDIPLPRGSIRINLPDGSPLLIAGTVTDQSRATARGAAMVIDLDLLLQLRNVSGRQIHGVTLRVVAQEVTVGGYGSVAYPSLHVGPGETFPARIAMQLVRPTQAVAASLVEVNLDGVLFQDLSFYGPDRLNSQRTMTAREMEAQRDREYFKRVLAQAGFEGLKTAMLESLTRQAERPRLDVRVTRGGPAVTSAANPAPERAAQFAFLKFPDSPVAPVDGYAQIAANEARAPRIDVRNDSKQVVKYVEIGWLVRDQGGRQYMAASIPAADPGLLLRPGGTARVLQDAALNFSRDGRPVNIQNMTGFVSQVQFADGKMWAPGRGDLEKANLLNLLPPSSEEQRLSDVYRKKGINALVEELKKY